MNLTSLDKLLKLGKIFKEGFMEFDKIVEDQEYVECHQCSERFENFYHYLCHTIEEHQMTKKEKTEIDEKSERDLKILYKQSQEQHFFDKSVAQVNLDFSNMEIKSEEPVLTDIKFDPSGNIYGKVNFDIVSNNSKEEFDDLVISQNEKDILEEENNELKSRNDWLEQRNELLIKHLQEVHEEKVLEEIVNPHSYTFEHELRVKPETNLSHSNDIKTEPNEVHIKIEEN